MNFKTPNDIPADQARKLLLEFLNEYIHITPRSICGLARNINANRSNLSRSLNPETSINVDTLIKVLNELNIELILKPKYPIIRLVKKK